MSESVLLGTDLKFVVAIEALGFSQERDDWSVSIMRGTTVIRRYAKEDMVNAGEGEFIMCVRTESLEVGDYDFVVTAKVPDGDFDDGFRNEVFRDKLMTVKRL